MVLGVEVVLQILLLSRLHRDPILRFVVARVWPLHVLEFVLGRHVYDVDKNMEHARGIAFGVE